MAQQKIFTQTNTFAKPMNTGN